MRPHEAQAEVRFNGGNTCITVEGQGIVAYGKLEYLQFFAAAPALARALLEHGRFAVEPNGDATVWHTHECWKTGRAICTLECQRDRDALQKGKVIP